MKYLVAGLGSIGRRHLKNIRKIDPDATVTVWHTHSKPGRTAAPDQTVDNVVYSVDDAIRSGPDVAFVTGPAPFHIPIAKALAEEGVDLFIEKPLSSNLSGIDALEKTRQERKNIIMVGYNLRFHRPFQVIRQALDNHAVGEVISIRAEVGQYLPDWRPDADYRNSVSARKELGGGAVLELSHELDYVRWLLGEVSTVFAHVDRVSSLEIDCEDTADIILKFANGATGSVHLDMVQRVPARYCRIIGTEGTLLWDGTNDSVSLFSAGTKSWSFLLPATTIDRNEMYLTEIRHFLDCVKTRKEPAVSLADGRRIIEIALAILRSSEEMRSVSL